MRSAIVLSMLVFVLLAPLAEAEGWSTVEVIKFQGVQNPDMVLRQIAKGEYDLGLFSLSAEDYRRLDENLLKNLQLYKTVVSYVDLTFNTYHDPDKGAPLVTLGNETYFNPFAIRQIRFAMNLLISREHIAQEIYTDGAKPMLGCIRPSHPANKYFEPVYRALNLTVEGSEELALRMVDIAMREAVEKVARYGHRLEKVNGTWHFDGRPVTVRFVIRVEDERKAVGTYVSKQLRKAGFVVEELFWDRQKAGQVVFARPPSNYGWNIYTGGWKATEQPELWIDDYTAWFYSSWYGYLPGAMEPKHVNTVTVMDFLKEVGNGDPDNGLRAIGAEYYTTASELGEILNWTEEELTKLLTNLSTEMNGKSYAITSTDQYWDLQKISMGIGMLESARIFLIEKWELSPVNRERVAGITPDPNTGILNRWSLLDARTPDGTLKVAYFVPTCWLFCVPFNPVGGFDSHAFPANLWGLVHDPGIFLSSNGLYTPYRCNWTVERGYFTVPEGAVIYNQTQGWINSHGGETARVRVAVTCDFGEWHNGIKMRVADLKYYIAFLYTWAYQDDPDDPYYDKSLSDTAESLSRVLGFEFTDRGYVVYAAYAHPFADDLTARNYIFYPVFPWELYHAMSELVARPQVYGVPRKYSFSEGGKDISCLNLLSREHASDLVLVLKALREEKVIPNAIADDVGDPEVGYDRAVEWIGEKGHAVISNGPFYIERYVPENLSLELRAFRGLSPILSPATTPMTSQISTSSKPTGKASGGQSTVTGIMYAIGIMGVLVLALVLTRGRR